MWCVKIYVFVLVLYFVCLLGTNAKELPQEACRSQSNCIKLHECEPYMDLLKNLVKPLKPSVVEFLRAQQCGFEESEPKVCCTKLPKTLKILKNSRPSVNSGRINNKLNKAMIKELEESLLIKTISSSTSTTTEKSTSTTKKVNVMSDEERRKKADAINKAFSLNFADFSNDYDLFRRRKRSGDNILDVEVR